MTEAGLFIHPITYDDFGIPPAPEEELQQPLQVPTQEEILDLNNNLEAEQNAQAIEIATSVSPEPDIDEIIKQAQLNYANDKEEDDELDAEMQRKIEEMIESVMNTAREEADWIKQEKENVNDEKIDNVEKDISEEIIEKVMNIVEESKPHETIEEKQDEPPLPPPRRKSNIDESILKRDFSAEEEILMEQLIVSENQKAEEKQASIETEPITEDSLIPEDPAIKEPSFEKSEYENEIGITPDIQQLEDQEENKEQVQDDMQMEISRTLSEDRPSSPFPSRLHLSSLEIDSLSVSQLQAGRITASEIDSHSIVTNEFESKSTNLPGQTVQIELPPGLIDEIVERVRNAERAEIQALLEEQQKIVEEQKIAIEEQKLALEKQKQEEEHILAMEKQRLLEEQKLALERQKLAEEQRIAIENQKHIEEQRIAFEKQKLAEEQRLAAEAGRILEAQLAKSSQQVQPAVEMNPHDDTLGSIEEQIVKKEITSESQEVPAKSKQEDPIPPERPPLPEEYQQPSSQIPQSFYQLRDISEEDQNKAPHHSASHHRRRKHQPKKKDSTSDDDYQKDQRPRSRAGVANDQSVAALGGQFLRACGNSLIDSGNQLMEILRASSKDENNRDLHVALIILIVIVAGLFLMGTGSDKSVHHHHWDFFNPPENQGR